MANEVRVKIDSAVVGPKDFEIFVKSGTEKLGTLVVSRGNLEWLPGGLVANKRRLTWGQFASLMEEHGTVGRSKAPWRF